MRRTIVIASVCLLVLAITTPSAAARQPAPIPTTCATHWLHNGWDVNGKYLDEYWYDDEGILHHHGAGWMRANGDPYCEGSWWVDGNWVLNEATGDQHLWGTIRMELSTPSIDGGFETNYEANATSPAPPVGEVWGEGYGDLEGWEIWMFSDGISWTGYVTPAK